MNSTPKFLLLVLLSMGIVLLVSDLGRLALDASEKQKKPSDRDRITKLEADFAQLVAEDNEHLQELYNRTNDLNSRLSVFEQHMNDLRAKQNAEVNGLDARLVDLERPDVEDDAK